VISIGCFEGARIYEIPQEPVSRRQLLQRQKPLSIGSVSLGKSTLRLKEPHAQVEVMLVVILNFEVRKVLNYLGRALVDEGK